MQRQRRRDVEREEEGAERRVGDLDLRQSSQQDTLPLAHAQRDRAVLRAAREPERLGLAARARLERFGELGARDRGAEVGGRSQYRT